MAAARKCKHCGEYLDERLRKEMTHNAPRGLAPALSLMVPGAGQLYNGYTIKGIGFFVGVSAAYALGVLGIVFIDGPEKLGTGFLPALIGLVAHFFSVGFAADGE